MVKEHILPIANLMKDEGENSLRVEQHKISAKQEVTNDWQQLFRNEKSLGVLQYHEPTRLIRKVIVKPPMEAIREGIVKWSPTLVGQFLEKPLPFFLVKRTVDSLWANYGKVEVFLLENGLYMFQSANEKAWDEVMEAKL
jgi:hypothetical protein